MKDQTRTGRTMDREETERHPLRAVDYRAKKWTTERARQPLPTKRERKLSPIGVFEGAGSVARETRPSPNCGDEMMRER